MFVMKWMLLSVTRITLNKIANGTLVGCQSFYPIDVPALALSPLAKLR